MTVIAVLAAVLITACIVFVAAFVPSESNTAGKDAAILGLGDNWKIYLVALAGTAVALALGRLWLEGKTYTQFSDAFIFYTPLLVVSPGARRMYRRMKGFFLRR
ncbi:hypothetical protein [Polaromonas sp. JS666]|uniref:hypothetical protein n=1 Tax=Polaromonas sp. (strain JS666 / ATCC BAA-500) TaxID=296591 RepID=UPI00087FD057|nr:hypothetical protein [Polaromonas sp. JS666]SDM99312.1 hypothetical protein SAMN05720382_1032 [Polaromonas sp. JS666]